MIIAGKFCKYDCISGIDICTARCEIARELRDSAARAVIDTFDKELGYLWRGSERQGLNNARTIIAEELQGVIEELITNGRMT